MQCHYEKVPIDYEGVVTCMTCGHVAFKRKGLAYRRNCQRLAGLPGTAGTHLKHLLQSFFVVSTKGCKCQARAEHMNAMGNDWCEQNLETIVEWLKEEAAARGLPFISTVGRMIVRRAISNARKEAQRAKADT
jgi:hypothetical protein